MGSKMKQDKAVASPPLTPARDAGRGTADIRGFVAQAKERKLWHH